MRGSGLAGAILAAIACLAAGCESIGRDELRCEEAVANIMDCCPGLAGPPVACVGTGTLPFVQFPDVACLLDRSCGELQAGGVCAWASAPAGRICP